MRVAYEGARGCGFRKPGGLYLVSDGIGQECDLLPMPLTVCPTCGCGVKPARGWTWVSPDGLLPHHLADERHAGCPLNAPGIMGERAGLLWIGERFYRTPVDWISEGRKMGFSRRIKSVPKGFEIGTTWVLTAHRKAIVAVADGHVEETPGIFHVWRPTAIEYVVKGDETEEEIAAIEKRGLTPVEVRKAQTEMAV